MPRLTGAGENLPLVLAEKPAQPPTQPVGDSGLPGGWQRRVADERARDQAEDTKQRRGSEVPPEKSRPPPALERVPTLRGSGSSRKAAWQICANRWSRKSRGVNSIGAVTMMAVGRRFPESRNSPVHDSRSRVVLPQPRGPARPMLRPSA